MSKLSWGFTTLGSSCEEFHSPYYLTLAAGKGHEPILPTGYLSWKELESHVTYVVKTHGVSGSDIEDVTQQTVLKLIENYWCPKDGKWLITGSSARALVSTIAYHAAMTFHRATSGRRQLITIDWCDKLPVDEDPATHDLVRSVNDAIAGAALTPNQELVVRSRLLAQRRKTYEELSEELKLSKAAIRGLVNRAYGKLRTYIERHYGCDC